MITIPQLISSYRLAQSIAPLLGNAALPATVPGVELWHWFAFGALVLVLLVVDLGVFHRDSREPTLRESAWWTVIWCLIALAFNGLMWFWRGPVIGVQFLTGYVLEWSLSMDNVFIFAVLFNTYFKVPLKYQYRVLFWGILGAIAMRLTFILIGAEALRRFDWVLPVFGLVLVFQGFKIAFQGENEINPEKTIIMRVARRLLPVAQGDHGEKFFVVEHGRRMITPLFLVLLVIEWTDVIFAVDSVPAIFGVTLDPFTVFTSNIFAILGLRALYFLLAGATDLLRFLKYGLSAVLVFIGAKMVIDYSAHRFFNWPPDEHVLSHWVSLGVVVGLLGVSVAASLAFPHPAESPAEKKDDRPD